MKNRSVNHLEKGAIARGSLYTEGKGTMGLIKEQPADMVSRGDLVKGPDELEVVGW